MTNLAEKSSGSYMYTFEKGIKWVAIYMMIALTLCFSNSIRAQSVKIYSVRDTIPLWDKKYKSEIYWAFYKVDFDKKSIQATNFSFREGDKAPDLTDLFKDASKDYFVFLSPTKIKVKRIAGSRVKRAWNDFATPGRTGGSASKTFFIIGDTLSIKGSNRFALNQRLTGKAMITLDKELTESYAKQQKND